MAAKKSEIIIASIGLLGVLVTAVLSNYEKLFPSKDSKTSAVDINVNLVPPPNVTPEALVLVSGTYKYRRQADSEESAKLSGELELVAPQASPNWTAKLPYVPPAAGNTGRTVKLTLADNAGRSWEVLEFYPNFTKGDLRSSQVPLKQGELSKASLALRLVSDAVAQAPAPKRSAKSSCPRVPSEIKFNNWTKATGQNLSGRDYYVWRVYVDEDKSVLDCISEIQYLLHPTFPNPVQVSKNRNDKFALEMSGWGEFTIDIYVGLTNGNTLNTSYRLDFRKPWQ